MKKTKIICTMGPACENEAVLADGDKFVFTTEECVGCGERVSVSYKNLPGELSGRLRF